MRKFVSEVLLTTPRMLTLDRYLSSIPVDPIVTFFTSKDTANFLNLCLVIIFLVFVAFLMFWQEWGSKIALIANAIFFFARTKSD